MFRGAEGFGRRGTLTQQNLQRAGISAQTVLYLNVVQHVEAAAPLRTHREVPARPLRLTSLKELSKLESRKDKNVHKCSVSDRDLQLM